MTIKQEKSRIKVPKMRIYLADIHRKGGAFPDQKKEAAKKKCRERITY